MRSISVYKEIYRKKGAYTCLREVMKRIWPVYWVSELPIRERLFCISAKKSVRKYVERSVVECEGSANRDGEEKEEKRIWVFWMQGEENAPDIVKKCIESIRRYSGGREVVIITEKNIGEYVDIPEYITKKLNKGKMTYTHFSDILRMALLTKHGGIWMDATVLLTGPLPEYITDEPLFMYKASLFLDGANPTVSSSWLIACEKGNKLITETYNAVCEYWKEKNVLADYFLIHLLFALVTERNETNRRLWKSVPFFNYQMPLTLQFELFDEYNEKRWKQLCEISSVHKLSYKVPKEKFEKSNTFYSHLFEQ